MIQANQSIPWSGRFNSQRRPLKCKAMRKLHQQTKTHVPFKPWLRHNFSRVVILFPNRFPTPMLYSKALTNYCR